MSGPQPLCALTPSESYAAAALFALALRETLAEARAGGGDDAFETGGLAQRVFADLAVPSRAWPVRRPTCAVLPACPSCAFPRRGVLNQFCVSFAH